MGTQRSADVIDTKQPTPKQAKFIAALSEGVAPQTARKLAGYKSNDLSQVLKSKNIQAIVKKAGLLVPEVLDGVTAKHMLSRDAQVALKAVDIGNKVKGRYIQRIESVSVTAHVATGDAIADRIAKLMELRERERHGRK